MIQRTLNQYGAIDLLFNNAGSFQFVGPVWEADPEVWWRDVSINLQGTMLCSRAVLPHMIERDAGVILTMDGGGGASGANVGGSAYGCSKAAIVRFTEGLARELEYIKSSVLVFCINPGFVRTPMTEYLMTTPEKRVWQAHVPKLMGSAREVPPDACAKATLHLLRVACPELNGRTFTVDTDFEDIERNRQVIQQQNLYVMERKTSHAER
jgi:NAD(P)-dependent dehydrogenase (short-subunit alcohol dehydrogenase family)